MRKNYQVKLNLRVGFLKFVENTVRFDNLASDRDLDAMSKTTCNTEFKANKWFLTNYRGPRAAAPDAETEVSYRSSVRDAISSVISPRTPKSMTSGRLSVVSRRTASLHAGTANPNNIE